MKNIYYTFLTIFTLICLTNCKKSSGLTGASTYDSENNIFRVKASSAGADYTIKISTINAATGTLIDQETGDQSLGDAFEYPFVPAAGDSIKIVAQSNTGVVYLYPLYNGNLLPGVVTQNQNGGGSIVSFNYLIK